MKTSLKEYIDGLDLTPEEKKAFEPVLGNEKVRGAIDKELSGAQSEISRRFDEAKAEKLKTENYRKELADWKSGVERTVADKDAVLRQANETAAKYKARLDTYVQSGVIDESEVADLVAAGPAPKKEDPPRDPNTGQYLTREDFVKEAVSYVKLPAQINDLAAKHYALFGKMPDNLAEIVDEAMSSKRTVADVWKEKYKVSEREQELASQKEKEHEEQIRRDERQKVVSEMSNPTNPRPVGGFNSPVLANMGKKPEGPSHLSRGVMAAVEAARSGKYKDGEIHE